MDIVAQVGVIAYRKNSGCGGEIVSQIQRTDSGQQPKFQAQILTSHLSKDTDPLLCAMNLLTLFTDIPADSCHWTSLGPVMCQVDNGLTVECRLYLASVFGNPSTCFHNTSMSWVPFSEAMKLCMDPDSWDFKDQASSAGLPRAYANLLTNKWIYGE